MNTKNTKQHQKLSHGLLVLLYAVKISTDDIYSFEFVRKTLAETYHKDMSIRSCLTVCMNLSFEACDKINPITYPPNTPFMETRKGKLVDEIANASYKLFENPTKLFPEITDAITFETMYLNQLCVLLSHLRLTNISNCKDYQEFKKQNAY